MKKKRQITVCLHKNIALVYCLMSTNVNVIFSYENVFTEDFDDECDQFYF